MATYTVKSGDCLWSIAASQLGNALRWTEIADLNGISRSNPIIHPGQVLNLDVGSSSSTSTPPPNYSTKVNIEYFGLQAGTDKTVFITWAWDRSNTNEYQVLWEYGTGSNGVWFVGSDSNVKYKQSTYTAPSNAAHVRVKIKPISETYTSNNNQVSYWTAEWSTVKEYWFSENPPSKPAVPTVEIDGFKLTAELDNLDVNGTSIEFQVVRDNTSIFKTGAAEIITNHASYSCAIDAGSEYKVRCRVVRGSLYSDWSEYSSNVETVPAASGGITELKALSETSVYIAWAPVSSVKSYDIEYATKIDFFDSSSEALSTSVESIVNHAEIVGIETGEEYFFRVRAVNDKGNSAWTEIRSIVIGKKPSAPTTWSSTTTAVVGEPLILYWVHNAEDGSSQTYAELELTIDGVAEVKTIKNSTDEELKDKTSSYSINTTTFTEGTKILWRVRTAGITKTYGDWSVQRTVDVYAPPTLSLSMTNINGTPISSLGSFPFYVYGLSGPKTQVPIGYHLTITSKEIYQTVDNVGNIKMVNLGEPVYSKYFDISDSLLVEFSANNIDLENNIGYTITCVVSMNSGLTAEESLDFTVSWEEKGYIPNAEIGIDADTLAAHIRPYCEYYPFVYYEVEYDSTNDVYTKTSNVIDELTGLSVDSAITTTGEIVYSGADATGNDVHFCMVIPEKGSLVEGVTLSVYRREFDGKFTEIAKGLNNTSNTFVTDPHPALDYARYRVVAITNATGAVSYYDVPGYPVQEKAVIIQWSEEWSSFDFTNEDAMVQPAWSGSMLKLRYNIDVSDSNKSDVALVEYIGREHPVSYYGTQLGITSTWSVEIPKYDKETLYALRRLMIWMGDVYVREPSGSGYWANIAVSFSQKHCDLTIPVTLDVTRVEGGV